MLRNMKCLYVVVSLLILILTCAPVMASPPTLAAPVTQNVGTNMATLVLQSGNTGTGYFTLQTGRGEACGTGAQVAAGQNHTGAAAPYHGSLPLTANISGLYTVRNLTQNIDYTICFTADSPGGTNLNPAPVSADLATAAITSQTSHDSGWDMLGSAGFSGMVAENISLAFAPDSTPYVAIQGFQAGSGAVPSSYPVTVMKYNSGTWSTVGSVGATVATGSSPQSLAFAPDGTPYVLFSDKSVGGKATVMMFTDGAWSVVGVAGFSGGSAYKPALAFAPDGTPSVLFGDGIDRKATLMQYRGGTWRVVGSAGVSAGSVDCPSLAFAPDGSPYVAYVDNSNNFGATVMKFSGDIWSVVGSVGFSDSNGVFNTSLAVAPDGTPYLAFADYGIYVNAKVMKFSEGTWSIVGNAEISNAGNNGVNFTSLAIAPDGTPYVAYEDGGNSYKATVMKFSRGTWSAVGIPGFSGTGNFGVNFTSLAIDPAGAPSVAYSDGNYSWNTTVMKYYPSLPTITGVPPSSTTVGILYSFTPVSNFESVIGFFITGNVPPGFQFDPATGTLIGIAATAGTYTNIVIGVTVTGGVTASLPPFSITVNPPAPTISGTPGTKNSAGSEYSFTPTTTNAANFTIDNQPLWSSFNSITGALTGTPAIANVGTYSNIMIAATNVTGSASLTPFSITVYTVPCRIVGSPQIFESLQSALNAADSGADIQAVGMTFNENLTKGTAADTTLSGGWDPTFSTQSGCTVLQRPLVINRGKLVVDHVIIR